MTIGDEIKAAAMELDRRRMEEVRFDPHDVAPLNLPDRVKDSVTGEDYVIGKITPMVPRRDVPLCAPSISLDAKAKAEAAPIIGQRSQEMAKKMREHINKIRLDVAKEELGEGADGGGKRLNKGKTKIELTPPEWEWALADVSTQGSKKYAERNWELGMKWSTMIGAMKRHVLKFQAGERYDGEKFSLEEGTTGCHHLAMVAWNALALMSYDLRIIGQNDMPYGQLELFDRINAETSKMGNDIHDS